MKKSLLFLAMFFSVLSTQAAVMQWQVTSDTVNQSEYLKTHLDSDVHYAAHLRFGTGDNYLDYGVVSEANGGFGVVGGDPSYATIDVSTLGADPTTLSYYIEILQADSSEASGFKSVAKSEVKSYDQLVKDVGCIASELSPSMQAWTGGTGYTVPEPTSALMMLFGVAFLGLKRRRV